MVSYNYPIKRPPVPEELGKVHEQIMAIKRSEMPALRASRREQGFEYEYEPPLRVSFGTEVDLDDAEYQRVADSIKWYGSPVELYNMVIGYGPKPIHRYHCIPESGVFCLEASDMRGFDDLHMLRDIGRLLGIEPRIVENPQMIAERKRAVLPILKTVRSKPASTLRLYEVLDRVMHQMSPGDYTDETFLDCLFRLAPGFRARDEINENSLRCTTVRYIAKSDKGLKPSFIMEDGSRLYGVFWSFTDSCSAIDFECVDPRLGWGPGISRAGNPEYHDVGWESPCYVGAASFEKRVNYGIVGNFEDAYSDIGRKMFGVLEGALCDLK